MDLEMVEKTINVAAFATNTDNVDMLKTANEKISHLLLHIMVMSEFHFHLL